MERRPFKRSMFSTLESRLNEKRAFIQVLVGPRQCGKTTLAIQLLENLDYPNHYATADEPAIKDGNWIEQHWETARLKISGGQDGTSRALLVLDEIQKIPQWSETVKRLWDEDTRNKSTLQVLLLGSSALLIQKGLSESLAGRFEITRLSHWSFQEMNSAFGWTLDQYILYGGYPGSAGLIHDPQRWRQYILDSLIETTISRDILLLTRVDKPILLRRLFEFGCIHSGQILSFHKMLGQLHDAGNTTTLAHYLTLLDTAGMMTGISKYTERVIRRRASSPKLLVLNNALMTALSGKHPDDILSEKSIWGRWVETAVGAVLYNHLPSGAELYYWLDRNHEVDFVIKTKDVLIALEVKSGQRKTSLPGIKQFSEKFKVSRKLLVGAQGISLSDFFRMSPGDLL